MWNWLFGGGNSDDGGGGGGSRKNDPNKTIGKMNDILDLLSKRETHLKKQRDKHDNEIKIYMSKDQKIEALHCLKKKKRIDEELKNLRAQMDNVETISGRLEQTVVNLEVFKAQKRGATALKTVTNEMSVDKIELEMDKVKEAMEDADDITRAVSQPLGTEVYDDDALESELNELNTQQHTTENSLPQQQQQVQVEFTMEDVKIPKTKIGIVNPSSQPRLLSSVDDELIQLEAELHGK
jgi:charged multivesicular body protein 4